MKTTRLEYPEQQSKPAQIRNASHRVAVESWPSPIISVAPQVVEISPSTTTTTTTTIQSPTTPTTPTQPTTLLSEQDTNKHIPKSTRKPKRRNNMRYMTQPVRLIEIHEEIQEEE